MKSLPQEYLAVLSRDGRELKELGIDGVALPKRAALEAVEALRKAACAPILGGEVFRVTGGKVAHTYDTWDCMSDGARDSERYLKDSLRQADAYIRRYPDPEDGSVLYQIVLPKPWHVRSKSV